MNVLRLTPHYYFETKSWPSEFDPLGGMQTQITCMSEVIAQQGIKQTIITSGYPGVEKIDEVNIKVIPVSKFRIKIKSKIGGLVCFDLFWLVGSIKWLIKNRNEVKKFDIIHNHYSGTYASIIASVAVRLLFHKQQVITIHCSRNFTFIPPNLHSKLMNGFIKKLEKYTVNKSKKIIVLTHKQKEKYLSLNIPERKIQVIGDSIPDYHLKVQKVGNEKWYKDLEDKTKKIAFVGRISFEKGYERLVDIALKMKENVKIFVVGDGPQMKELKKSIIENELEDKFILTGFISKLKIPYVLSLIDVLVVPSKHEEFGGVILEGVTANKPIVTSGVGGISKILGDTYNGIVDSDTDSYVSSIEKFLKGELKPNYDREEIIKKYNIENNVKHIIDIYNES